MSRCPKYSGETGTVAGSVCGLTIEGTKELTIGRSSTKVADEFLTSVNEQAPRIDVTSTPLTPRRTSLSKVDDGNASFCVLKLSEGLDDESEWELRCGCEVVGVRERVGRHAQEARIAISCTQGSAWRTKEGGNSRTLIDSDEIGRCERSGRSGTGEVGFGVVGLLILLLHGDGGRNMIGINLDAHARGDPGALGMGWLLDGGLLRVLLRLGVLRLLGGRLRVLLRLMMRFLVRRLLLELVIVVGLLGRFLAMVRSRRSFPLGGSVVVDLESAARGLSHRFRCRERGN